MRLVTLFVSYIDRDEEITLNLIDDEEFCVIEILNNDGNVKYEADSFFEALTELRNELEKLGGIIQCNGSDKYVFPSPLQMSMGGEKAYHLELGKPASLKNVYEIFGTDKPVLECVTVEEQRKFYDTWLNSIVRRV